MAEEGLRESWNRLSAFYQQKHQIGTDAPHYGVLAPNESDLRLLGNVAGKRVLEIGCGGGQNALAFANWGATCVGIDLSDAQIAYAVGLAEQEGFAERVAFRQGEMIAALESLSEGELGTFDLVFSAYALQYVGDLPRCFAGVFRALRPGGIFAFSFDHPLSAVVRWDQDGNVAKFARSYFERGADHWEWHNPLEDALLPMTSYLRTVGDVVNAVTGSGLVLDCLLEPEPTDEFTTFLEPGDHELFAQIPATLIVRASRPSPRPLP